MRAILESLRATGDPVDTLEIRRRLAESFDDPDERADVYRELGDTWRDRFDAPDRALESYERAVDTAPTPELWERIRSTAEALGDADHRYEARLALAEHADDDETTADHLFEASVLARDDLGEPERALRGFEEVYELDPSRFEAFQAIESLLQAAEDWHRLEAAYRWALDSTREREDVEDDVRAILWFKLGELRESQLDAPREAIEAYREASDLFPESPKFHEAIVSVAKSQDEDAEIAERHLRALYELDPNRIDVLKRLGRLYLKRDELDAALCHLRAHDALGGHLDERASSFLEQFETGMYNSPDRTLGADLRREYLEPASFDPNLGRVFALLFPVLHDWTSEFRSEYGLDGDDYVDLDEPLAFNNIYRDVAGTLGWDQPPDLWRHAEYRALTKAALDEPAVIAGDDLFGSGDEKRIAFATAKTLFLLERPFYLLGLRDVSDLQAFFLLALQMVRPEVEFERDEAMEEAYQTMDRAIEGDQRDQLRDAIDAATDESDEIDLQGWVEAVEDAANRAGLLFAGDLEVARMHLESETDSFSERSVETRLHELVTYSLSDDYLALRDALGISVA
jgi:tetratricopeptide (TPR) repeat protein